MEGKNMQSLLPVLDEGKAFAEPRAQIRREATATERRRHTVSALCAFPVVDPAPVADFRFPPSVPVDPGEIIQTAHWLCCADGAWISATLFEESDIGPQAPVLIVNCATGNKQSRYFDMARWWAARGWRVVTYDYRGIGMSALPERQSKRFRLWEWGSEDMSAVVEWIQQEFTPITTVVIGHSIGSQIIQFCRALNSIDAVVFVAGQKGCWRNWCNRYRYPIWAFWHVVLPTCVGICGNFPLMRLAGCATLPRNVALDWARWGRARTFAAETENFGHELGCPLLSISIADDQLYGPEQAVDALLEWYPNAQSERLHLAPETYGIKQIGHAGLFDAVHFDRFWPLVSNWLDRRVAGPRINSLIHRCGRRAGLGP
ncbi:MAG: alpha/beta fold hydrolase [Rhodopila sp.]